MKLRLVGRLAAGRAVAPLVRGLRTVHSLIEPAADRIAIAPQDLRTADPTVANDIYAGVFVFSGQIVECRGRSPFEIEPPNREWARVLHGFGWLRHLRAADTAVSRSNARILVDDWLRFAAHSEVAWEPEIAARRLMAWLAQSPMILAEADPALYHRFLAGVTRHFRHLRALAGSETPGLPRLKVAIALLAATITVESFRKWVRGAARRLDDELARQILPDGGHIGRNPTAGLDVLIDLLPIRQAMAARGFPVSPVMMGAIDRMMPMIRFFRHGDGAFALFNGASATATDVVATVLAYDDGKGTAHGNASHSGYQRLEAGGTVVLMDCGAPPPPEVAQTAHAGTLAFEMSSGACRFVVNCGTPFRPIGEWRRVARASAAHSTLIVEDHSSAHVEESGLLARWLGPVLVGGPSKVDVERREDDEGTLVVATHDGYRDGFDVLHERSIALSEDGDRLDGLDRILPATSGGRCDVAYVVRFHLHPTIRAEVVDGVVQMVGVTGEAWEFHCADAVPVLEDSVHLADLHGLRRTAQISLAVADDGPREIGWVFLRTVRSIIPRR